MYDRHRCYLVDSLLFTVLYCIVEQQAALDLAIEVIAYFPEYAKGDPQVPENYYFWKMEMMVEHHHHFPEGTAGDCQNYHQRGLMGPLDICSQEVVNHLSP